MQLLSRLSFSLAFSLALGAFATPWQPPSAHAQTTPAATAQARTFAHRDLEREATRYERSITENIAPSSTARRDLIKLADRLLSSNPRAAIGPFSQAIVADRTDAAAWLGLARALLATPPATPNSSERYTLPLNASAAAYLAYQRGARAAFRAESLAVLAEALQRRSSWRPALDALATSLALAENAQVRRTYETLRAQRGFRIVNHQLDSDAASPRLCVQFSEPLKRGDIDFAKFLSVDGRDVPNVTVEPRQLCIEGLRHGERVVVQVRAGLPSEVGETLPASAEIAAYVRDRSPTVRVSGHNYVLPSLGQQGLPLVSINTDKATVEFYRIGDRSLARTLQDGDFQRQLYSWDRERLRQQTGARIWAGELETANRLNEEVTTAVPVSEVIGKMEPGVYAMVARAGAASADDNGGEWATQWFIVSDLGLTALSGGDGVHAFVRALSSAAPVAGAKVRLIARNNEVLGQGTTDAAGYARFDGGLARGEGGLAPAVLVAEGQGGDYAFLDLTASAFDLTDRGVKGRPAPGPLDGFVFTERGIYRPGEDVHVTALVRDQAGKSATLPVTVIVTRPDGVEHRRFALSDQGLGGRLTTLGLSGTAMTGTWRLALHADVKAAALAQSAFLVEDFVPERLALALEPVADALRPNETGAVDLTGNYLYGPPAANLALEAEVIVKSSDQDVAGFPGYRFGQADESFSPVRRPLEGLPNTDAQGKARIEVALPALTRTARPLAADVLVRLREPGGRTIERKTRLPVDLGVPRIGIKPRFGSEGPGENGEAGFDVVMLDAGSKAVAAKLDWQLLRLETSWQWFKRDGQWTYEGVTLTRKAASGTAATMAATAAAVVAPVRYGRYRLEVTADGAPEAAASFNFTAGWHVAEGDIDTPELLEVALDKASYQTGETARVRIASRHAGKALVAVLGTGVHQIREIDVEKGGAELAVMVENEWGAGVYVTAILYRAMDEKARRMPSRAIGVAWLGLDQSARTLDIALGAPAKVGSGASLSVPIKIAGLQAGEAARVTLAAVDVGILNLTGHKAPRPQDWFFAQRQLGFEFRDFYGRLIDGMRAERGRLRSGGDGEAGMSAEGSPPVEKLVALHSGIVTLDAEGRATVDFQLPDFNGTVRLMAVAWSAGKIGSASRDVIVRDPVALTVSGPRFITLGDKARVAIDVHNVDGAAADYDVSLARTHDDGRQDGLMSRSLRLDNGMRKSERIALAPGEVGLATYDVRVTGPGGIDVRRALTFDIKPPAGDIRRTTVSQIAPGGSLSLSTDLTHDLIAERTRINLSVGPYARLDVPGLLTALDRYPYGCAEQTVSRALPLLYANAVAETVGLARDKSLEARIEAAIARVFEMQDGTGAFGTWGPWNGDIWLTSYVTDFLTRAKEAGFAVDPRGLGQALDRLQSVISYAQDFEKGGEDRAYALYVLARNARAPIGDLRYYADTRLDRFATPLAQAQIGAALAMLGDTERAGRVFRTALASLDGEDSQLRQDYGSKLRDGAALVTLASETGIARQEAPRLLQVVAKAYEARTYTSTQEQAWMLLAANALADQAKSLTLEVDGKTRSGQLVRTLTPDDLKAGALRIVNTGETPIDAVLSVTGAALTPEPAVEKGFTITRSAYRLDGSKVDLASFDGGTATLQQNERLVIVVKVEGTDAGGRVLLVDRLPAGLEIENPRIVDGGDVNSLSWLKTTVRPESTQFRDDRFVAAFNFFGSRPGEGDRKAESSATVAYVVRAVTPGSFVHPAATVEDMYRPERHARTAAGRLEVTAKE